MNTQQLLDALSDIREDFIQEAAPGQTKKRRQVPRWLAAAALAACLAVALIVGWPEDANISGSSAGSDGADNGSAPPTGAYDLDAAGHDGVPSITIGGVTYLESAHGVIFRECPDGFTYAGKAEQNGSSLSYYANPGQPEWVYIYQACYDQRNQEFYNGYVRYVEKTLRGLRLIRHDGQLYARLHDLSYLLYDEDFAAGEDFIQRMDHAETCYGSFPTSLPEGFTTLGKSTLEGYDTIPARELGSNFLYAGEQILANPDEPDILLVECPRYAHNPGETTAMEYELYLRFDFP